MHGEIIGGITGVSFGCIKTFFLPTVIHLWHHCVEFCSLWILGWCGPSSSISTEQASAIGQPGLHVCVAPLSVWAPACGNVTRWWITARLWPLLRPPLKPPPPHPPHAHTHTLTSPQGVSSDLEGVEDEQISGKDHVFRRRILLTLKKCHSF